MTNPAFAPAPIQRFLSLDVVRGITIAFMIMVNNNGGPGSWHFMNHAEWNGLTPTDLVFPTFVFVVGVSIVFAFEARLARGATRSQLAWHTLQRAAILIVFGILVNSFPFFALRHMRFYGVLQRIAICYLVVGLFYLWDKRPSTKATALAVALVGYWVLIRWVPIPGIGMPGRDVPFMDMTQNLVSWIDRHLFPYHLYLDSPDHNVRDPEGLLSDLPAIGTALMGVLTGLWLRSRNTIPVKTLGLAAASVTSLIVGYLWSLSFPLNKNMWTSSFVLFSGGFCLLFLSLLYWATEVRSWRGRWTMPILVFGMNAIAGFVADSLIYGPGYTFTVTTESGTKMNWHEAAQAHLEAVGLSVANASLVYSLGALLICWIMLWLLWRKKIFLKV